MEGGPRGLCRLCCTHTGHMNSTLSVRTLCCLTAWQRVAILFTLISVVPPTVIHMIALSLSSLYMASDSLVTDTTVDPSSITLPLHFDDFLLDHHTLKLSRRQHLPCSPQKLEIMHQFSFQSNKPTGSSSISATAASSGTIPSQSAPGNLGKSSLYSSVCSVLC